MKHKKKIKKKKGKKRSEDSSMWCEWFECQICLWLQRFYKKKKKKFVGKLSRPLHLYIKIVHFCIYIYAIQDNLLFLALDCTIFQ